MAINEAAKPKNPLVVFHEQLTARMGELRNALPAHMPPERYVRVVLTAVQQNPDLLACSRQSLWNACMRAAQDGLLPDGRDGAIVPFKDSAQWMPMVGGLLKRFRNSGQFKSITTNIVREGEEFSYWIDEAGEHLKHVPGDGSGKLLKVYGMAVTKDEGVMIRVMSIADVDKRRNASRAKNSPMWSDWYEEAAMKTVLRNLAKRLPSSADLDDLIRRDDELYDFGSAAAAGKPMAVDVAGALDHFGGKASDKKEEPEPEAEPEPVTDDADVDELPDAEAKAFDEGKTARDHGIQRRAVPPIYRTPEAAKLAKRWIEGWDAGAQ